MLGIYFSGTGNTRCCIERFVTTLDSLAPCIAIESMEGLEEIRHHDLIALAYPIYYSNLPKIMRDFIENNADLFRGKKVFIIATMGLFSGDGTGCGARLMTKCGAEVIGGLHLKMPDCIGDVKALKKPLEQNRAIVAAALQKAEQAAHQMQQGKPPREGLGFFYHMAGLFGQRLWFYGKTKHYSAELKINPQKCIGCGTCMSLCPMNNLSVVNQKAIPGEQCTLCYRCISTCPKQAITLLGKVVYEQSSIERYL